jgi:Tol biopolymer transport system component
MGRLVRVWSVVAIGLLAGPAAAEGASNGTIAFEIVQEEQTCDQCGPQGDNESFPGGARVWLVRPDGSRLRRLPCTSGKGGCSDHDPAFTHDGRRLAVRGSDGLVVMTAAGRRLQRLDPFPGWSPSWGPRGNALALANAYELPDGGHSFRVSVTDLAGNMRHLYEGGFISDIAWSGQGRLAWTVANERVGAGLWVGDARGRSRTRIAQGGYSVSWSPDGSRIAFASIGTLNVIDADGGRRRVLTRRCAVGYDYDGGVAWSPDGREIACVSRRRGNLVVLNLVTMRLRPVATWRRFGNGTVGDISWQAR